MNNPLTAQQVFDREYLSLRARIIEVAAALDRVERATGEVMVRKHHEQVHAALQVLTRGGNDRAEQIQLIFSRPYLTTWRSEFEV